MTILRRQTLGYGCCSAILVLAGLSVGWLVWQDWQDKYGDAVAQVEAAPDRSPSPEDG